MHQLLCLRFLPSCLSAFNLEITARSCFLAANLLAAGTLVLRGADANLPFPDPFQFTDQQHS
jgi:hypothetical protein